MKHKNGFSYIELTIALALVALVVSLASVSMRFLDRTIVYTELEKLYTVARYLQRRAIATNTPHELLCDIANNCYYYNGVCEKLDERVMFGCSDGIKGPPSTPRTVIAKPVTFKKERIVFHPDGIISPGTIYITDRSKKSSYALSSPIAQISYIRMYRYDTTWQQL